MNCTSSFDIMKSIKICVVNCLQLAFNESTVVAITHCGTKTSTAFLSHNFTRIFGYPRKHFIEGDLQFLIKHMHPDDLQSFISFAESSTLNASPWNEAKENSVHECCSPIKHYNGNKSIVSFGLLKYRHPIVASRRSNMRNYSLVHFTAIEC